MIYNNSLELPNRLQKPRSLGINMLIDKGLDFSTFSSYVIDHNSAIDYVKFTSGIILVDSQIKRKIELCKVNNIIPYAGGTLFEKFFFQSQIDAYTQLMHELEFDTVEISNGVLDADFEKISEYIKFFKDRGFKVLVEIGSKDTDFVMPPSIWIKQINAAIDHGADKLILEGRESGTAGLYRESGEIRTGLLQEIKNQISLEKLIFEAPNKKSQCYLINKFGCNVNLGNINFNDLNILEVQRLGLRYDTFFIKNE